ncbi:MAG: addiction module protein [Thermoanaerobaculia bacterium]
MGRALDQLEAEALELPEEARIHLIQRLLRSFEEPSRLDAAIAREWAEEAERRDLAMDRDEEAGVPAEEVFRRIETARR